jgi:hypothetical protein
MGAFWKKKKKKKKVKVVELQQFESLEEFFFFDKYFVDKDIGG